MSKAENFIPFSVKNPKPLEMPDCIYLTEQCKCGILNVRECLKEFCSFSQNRADREESQIQWRRRLSEMEEGRQAKIAAVYYGGKRPWKESNGKGAKCGMRQYTVGDMVLYSVHGICRIEDKTQRDFGGQKQEYYMLKPVYTPDSTFFVPVNNENMVSKMRQILSGEEIKKLIREMPGENFSWIEEEAARKERYQQILSDGDRTELVRMIKALYFHQQEQQKNGRRRYYR
ncbi:MAG: CarD family transcriptional regulator [Oscillospiraceae bacterium]